jgi:hypothetical protein
VEIIGLPQKLMKDLAKGYVRFGLTSSILKKEGAYNCRLTHRQLLQQVIRKDRLPCAWMAGQHEQSFVGFWPIVQTLDG